MTNQSLVVLPGHAGRLMSLLARGKAAICRVLDAGVMTRYQQHDLIPPDLLEQAEYRTHILVVSTPG